MRSKPEQLSLLACLASILLLCTTLGAAAANTVLRDDRGGRMEIVLDPQLNAAEREQMLEWLETIGHTLAGVYGHWPRKHWQVAVHSTSGTSADPIPWAQVNRGDVDVVQFFVVSNTPASELVREWTGYHELAHLLIPYRGWGDTWFSEGLASYYQNLLQARAGVIDERQMWQKLYDGFMRGRGDVRFDGQSLSSVSARLRVNGGFMRVYWSGAWYFLAADVALREASDGANSLDLALEKLNACCADTPMTVPDMVARLDAMNDVELFSRLYEDARTSTRVPDFESLFARMQIEVDNGEVSLATGTPGAKLRSDIARRPPL